MKPIKGYDFTKPPRTIEMFRISKEDRARFDERSYDWKYRRPFGILINGQVLCSHATYMDQSRLIPAIMDFTEAGAIGTIRQFMKLGEEYPYEVCEFAYDGFGGKSNPDVIMPYKARFMCWTGDPGIAMMMCSDGEKRFIPTYAMKHSYSTLPNDMTRVNSDSGVPVFFGSASKS